jgi:membrane associated rhomboid family serine protease
MFPLVTVFTSMFLHANITHLIGNLLYLLTFGPAIEWALGAPRFALYYLAWGIVASAAHTYIDLNAEIPVVGASGAIGGILGAYLLLFPANKIELIIPFVPVPVEISAWILLGLWFLFQVVFKVDGVANWAHVGGFMAGMGVVLVMGGRANVLRGRNPDEEDYEIA